MIGTREIQPPDAKLPKLRMDCTIRIGRPIKVERYQDRADDRMVLRQITDEVMFEIRELTGQEYRDVYATKKAEGHPDRDGARRPCGRRRSQPGTGAGGRRLRGIGPGRGGSSR